MFCFLSLKLFNSCFNESLWQPPLLVKWFAHQTFPGHAVAISVQFQLESLWSGVRNRGPLCFSKFIPPVSLMRPRDGCLNQRTFCFYAEMWALGCSQLCSAAFVSVPTSLPLPYFGIFSTCLSFFPSSASFLSSSIPPPCHFILHAVLLTSSPLVFPFFSCHFLLSWGMQGFFL